MVFFQLGMRPFLRCLHNSNQIASCSRGNLRRCVASQNLCLPWSNLCVREALLSLECRMAPVLPLHCA
jgi:hypothetical protein